MNKLVYIFPFIFLIIQALLVFGISSHYVVLEEVGRMNQSTSDEWWLNAGGVVFFNGKVFNTIQGEVEDDSRWRIAYSNANPTDTDNGFHPQNIFRLVSKNKYDEIEQEVYFNIVEIHLSNSENRAGSNGVLLMSRYLDGDNLYYSGVRVDGTAVIKKKRFGLYETLGQKTIFPGNYNRDENPNLIPEGKWIGIKTIVEDTFTGVKVSLYVDKENNQKWEKVLEVIDNATYSAPIMSEGSSGIRSDFMDVTFKDYKVKELLEP